jgi:selenocysteine lyase/cysteine desulfurase
VRLIGHDQAARRAPTVAFTAAGWSSAELAHRLSSDGLGVGVGHFYAYRLIEALGIDTDDGVVRASFVHYTRPEEVERLITALDNLL